MIYFVVTYSDLYREDAKTLVASYNKHNAEVKDCKLIEIDFDPHYSELARKRWPKNRPTPYSALSHGELLDYIDVEDDDYIIWVGADMIFQRQITEQEIYAIKQIGHGEVGYNICNFTQISLKDEYRSLLPKKPVTGWDDNITQQPLMGLGANILTVKTLKELRVEYLKHYGKMTRHLGHHAGDQWIWNYSCYLKGWKTKLMPITFHCASWYYNSPAEYDGQVLKVRDKVVFINHAKGGLPELNTENK